MTALPAAGYFSNNSRTQAEQKQWGEDIRNFIAQMIGGAALPLLTLSADSITPATAAFRVTTEGGAASDNLATILTTNLPDGSFIFLRSDDAAKDVVVKHNTGGSGKILLADSADLTLGLTTQWLLLVRNGADWEEVMRGYGNNKAAARAFYGLVIGTDVQAYDANTVKKNVANTFTAIQTMSAAARGTPVTLTDGATVTPDFAAGNFFDWTIGGNRTLANPTNVAASQSGIIRVTQDGTGGRTIAWGSMWKTPGGVAGTLSTAAGAVDLIVWWVEPGATRITYVILKASA